METVSEFCTLTISADLAKHYFKHVVGIQEATPYICGKLSSYELGNCSESDLASCE